jgi:CMP-N,N'-diacetyllegionaminic acid synthase
VPNESGRQFPMIDSKKVLAVIPARQGSKGLPGKNNRMLAGKPLLGWTIAAAQNSQFIDRLVLSSNDSLAMDYARSVNCEVPFSRTEELSSDTVAGVDVVIDAVNRCPGFDFVVLLQPTSPLRTTEDIDNALQFVMENNATSCISIVQSRSNPHWMYYRNSKHELTQVLGGQIITRRQDLPLVYEPNGAIYIAEIKNLLDEGSLITTDTVGYEMPRDRSIDIDNLDDFNAAEIYLQGK